MVWKESGGEGEREKELTVCEWVALVGERK